MDKADEVQEVEAQSVEKLFSEGFSSESTADIVRKMTATSEGLREQLDEQTKLIAKKQADYIKAYKDIIDRRGEECRKLDEEHAEEMAKERRLQHEISLRYNSVEQGLSGFRGAIASTPEKKPTKGRK